MEGGGDLGEEGGDGRGKHIINICYGGMGGRFVKHIWADIQSINEHFPLTIGLF